MTRPKSKQGGPPGRKTNQQIIDDWLQSLDITPEIAAAIRTADPRVQVIPSGEDGSATEMYRKARKELGDYYEKATGVAKVHTFKVIQALALAEKEAERVVEVEQEPLIADVVSGVASLSLVRKRTILSSEHERLVEETAAVEAALALMDEAVAV